MQKSPRYKVYIDGQLGYPFDSKEKAIEFAKKFIEDGFDAVVVEEKEDDISSRK